MCALLGFLLTLFLHVAVVLVVGVEQLVPPGEGGAVVTYKVHVVKVVEACAGVKRDGVQRIQWDVITAGWKKTHTGIRYCTTFNYLKPYS